MAEPTLPPPDDWREASDAPPGYAFVAILLFGLGLVVGALSAISIILHTNG